MNRNLEVINKLYKPYKITRKNKIYILNTMEGNFVVKENPKINYQKLYTYLKSRSFNYLPNISLDRRDDLVILDYQEDISINKEQKALDLINLVSLLHSKTAYFKSVTNDKYKEIYEKIKNNIVYTDNLYNGYFNEFINEEYIRPSHYLFLRNFTLINNANKYCLDKIDSWYQEIKDKNQERVCLVHNNLCLDHFIKNDDEYLISWDSYTFDSPVLDLYNFYLNEWMNISFIELFKEYNNNFELLPEEKLLLDILISIPFVIELDDNEYNNCQKVRELINYLNSSSKIVFND